MEPAPEQKIAEIAAKGPAFAPEAYSFVAEAVSYTGKMLRRKEKSDGKPGFRRHMSALELLRGAREYAREEFGAVAGCVLAEWGISAAADFGRVVYLLIEGGVLAASPEDDPRDFEIDFDLAGEGSTDAVAPRLLPFLDI